MRRWIVILRLFDGSGYNCRTVEAYSQLAAGERAVVESIADDEPCEIYKVFLFDEESGDLVLVSYRLESVSES